MIELVMIEKSTLDGIGDAVRERKGTTALIPVLQLRPEILSIGGTPLIAKSEQEMADLMIEENIGKFIRYEGEDGLYVNGAYYQVVLDDEADYTQYYTYKEKPSKLPLLLGTQDVVNKPYEITASDLEGVTEITGYAFYKRSGMTSIDLSNSNVTTVEAYAFSQSGVVSANIPNVTTIGNYAFNNCSSLTSVNMPNVITIGSNAFAVCQYLTLLTIPATCTSINQYALRCGYTTRKCTFIFEGTTPPVIGTQLFQTSYINKIIVPKGCGETYKTATNWATFADYIVEAEE